MESLMPRPAFEVRLTATTVITWLVVNGSVAVFAAAPADAVRFNRDIRPIMSDSCWHCHGPGTQKADLRLDRRDDALRETASGTVPIVPGKPEASEIIRRILAPDESELMPPADSHKVLKPEQKELLRRWVAEGAVYEKHWSFEPPQPPRVPSVAKGYRANNPIDAFVTERLAKEKLPMSPEADRPTLIRRVAFALTGLPPTPAEVDEYLNDKSPDAYEKMVDRYLASPHYGEEMARPWLDVARYADTHGLHLDNERQMWLFRDWVVEAFNQNKPFDAFTIEQLAGDLLPNAARDQLIATGFNRCNVSTSEGGSIADEWLFRNAVDRASTMAEAWLGLTAGCAVCHDHKYDPLSAKEFYSLYAFFYSIEGNPLDGNKLLHEPIVKLSTPAQEAKLKQLGDALAKVTKQIKERTDAVPYNDPAAAVSDDDDDVKSGDVEEAVLKAARDPERSFEAWVKANGGKDAAKIPADLKRTLQSLRDKDAVKKPTDAARKELLTYFVQNVCTDTKPQFEKLLKSRNDLTKQRDELDASIPGTFVFRDEAKPREAHVMLRGQYDKPGDKVEPNVPAVFPPLKLASAGDRPTRLDLAEWLVSPEHPLTARVTVNRLWQQFFGVGLVKTSYDFGAQGEPPSHPELLDWLAIRFAQGRGERGEGRVKDSDAASDLTPRPFPLAPAKPWDVKALAKLMLTSAAFRQSSIVSPEALNRDPENRLYARGPRFRLAAEQIRDNALYVSGLIHLDIGGKGVNPYQPPNIWEPVAYTGSNTRYYKQDSGPALYRRSLYTFVKRTAPPPYMTNFDAPNREQFCSGRDRTNTPLQALQLMNDVQHFEAARALAERIILEGGKTPDDRIAFAYRTVLSRKPDADELSIVRDEYTKHLARYEKDVAAANEVIGVGESEPNRDLNPTVVAAWTLTANMILNLDETVTRN